MMHGTKFFFSNLHFVIFLQVFTRSVYIYIYLLSIKDQENVLYKAYFLFFSSTRDFFIPSRNLFSPNSSFYFLILFVNRKIM